MTQQRNAGHGLGDPRIPWVVLLDVTLTDRPPAADVLSDELARMASDAGWRRPSAGSVSSGPRPPRLADLAVDGPDALRVAAGEHRLVLAARHDALDGLGMLTALGRLLGTPVRSRARGVGAERGSSRGLDAVLRRATEVAVRPPAVVAPSAPSARAGDCFAVTTVEGTPRTGDLVRAGALAVATWNREHHVGARRVSVAVGVSTAGGASEELADHSGFLRLRDVEQMTASQVRDALTYAPLQPGGGGDGRRRGRTAMLDLALRAAAPRLGSTLLVSHLGALEAPDSIAEAAFYPVTGGASGLSLGAARLRDRTTLTLRARASRHDDEGLQGLLALVVEELGRAPGHLA